LNAVASSFGVIKQKASSVNISNPFIPGGGREPKIVGAAFAMSVNDISKPLQGNTGVYVIQLLEKNEAPALPTYRAVAKEETEKRHALY